MSLADRIIDERKQAYWSQEELAHRLGVSRQAVSKWESEQAAPDISRVIQMADLFGVSTDYLLKGEDPVGSASAAGEGRAQAAPAKPARFVSEEEARDFLAFKRKSIPLIALGVALCIASPIVLILLDGLADDGIAGLSNEVAIAIGLPLLIICVGVAVFLFVSQGAKGEKYNYLEEDKVIVAEGALKETVALRDAQAEAFGRNMAIGVSLCVVACVPLVVVSCFARAASVICAFVALLLAIVAVGVYVMVRTAATRSAYDMLLQVKDYDPKEKAIRQRLNLFSAVFWLLAAAIYLICSFATGKWGATWVVWAVAGVLYAAGYAVAKHLASK